VNQFHDVLPGSSITAVYERTHRELRSLADDVEARSGDLLASLTSGGAASDARAPVNTLGFPRAEVALDPQGEPRYVVAPPFAAGRAAPLDEVVRLTCEDGGGFRLENGRLTAVLTAGGALRSLIHSASGREALAGEANRIVLFDDRPTNYEAWDIDPFALETARDAPPAHAATVLVQGPLRAEVRFDRRLGKASAMSQIVRLDAGADHLEFDTTLDWRERRTLVKAVFPIACRSRNATYETMFGAVERPTHANTDADLAMYEVPGHRWADLSEPGFGVSLLSDARYGFSIFGGQMGLSLVRGPVVPDPGADIGEHHFRYGLYPHAGDWRAADTVAHAARFNRPILWLAGAPATILQDALVTAAPSSVVIDTVKPAEDGEGWVVRLYESHGGRARAALAFGVPVAKVWLSNTLEDRLEPVPLQGAGCTLSLRGFQIVTLRLI
jgi:alpha-mannosidase